MQAFDARAREGHARQVGEGKHDDACEWRDNGHYLCNCSKRTREREGYTKPPGELIYQNPLCPRCYAEVEFDGDSWKCEPCRALWPTDGLSDAEFYDDYGPLDMEKWDRAHVGRTSRGLETDRGA
jgi:hypothetical protein